MWSWLVRGLKAEAEQEANVQHVWMDGGHHSVNSSNIVAVVWMWYGEAVRTRKEFGWLAEVSGMDPRLRRRDRVPHDSHVVRPYSSALECWCRRFLGQVVRVAYSLFVYLTWSLT